MRATRTIEVKTLARVEGEGALHITVERGAAGAQAVHAVDHEPHRAFDQVRSGRPAASRGRGPEGRLQHDGVGDADPRTPARAWRRRRAAGRACARRAERFDVTVISRYFPEFAAELGNYLSDDG